MQYLTIGTGEECLLGLFQSRHDLLPATQTNFNPDDKTAVFDAYGYTPDKTS